MFTVNRFLAKGATLRSNIIWPDVTVAPEGFLNRKKFEKALHKKQSDMKRLFSNTGTVSN